VLRVADAPPAVAPALRVAPRPRVRRWLPPDAKAEAQARGAAAGPVRILFLSEGDVCRSVLATALFQQQLAARGLSAAVLCESKGALGRARAARCRRRRCADQLQRVRPHLRAPGTRDYNVGEGPEPAAVTVAQARALSAPRSV
jgi:hypothetical protein